MAELKKVFLFAWLMLVFMGCGQPLEPVLTPQGSIDFEKTNVQHPLHQRFTTLITEHQKKGVPGLVMLVRDRNGLWNGAVGQASVELNTPMQPTHLHYSGSVAKTYTATAVMKLVEDGKIELDASITKYLSAEITDRIQNSDTITVRHLLRHRSGIRDFLSNKFYNDLEDRPDMELSVDIFMTYFLDKNARFAPNKKYGYSNSNYLLLALIMDSVLTEDQGHGEYINKLIFTPLDLKQSYYKIEEGLPKPEGITHAYTYDSDVGGNINVSTIQNYYSSKTVGEDGIIASTYDYALFIEALFAGKLVSQESLKLMSASEDDEFGLGYINTSQGKYYYKEGSNFGNETIIAHNPITQITIVLAANIEDGSLSDLLEKCIELVQG